MINDGALRMAVWVALSGNITGGVYDRVQPGTPFPYTKIGETTSVPWDTHDSDGSESTITLHTFGVAQDSQEVEGILDEIDALLHHKPLALASGSLVMLRREFKESFEDQLEMPGQRSTHGVLRYRALMSE